MLLEDAKEVDDPWLPVRLGGAEGLLGSSQSKIVGVLALLDDAFERAVRHVRIAAAEQQQRGQDPRQSAIAVLERVDREKHHDEDRDDEQGMKVAPAERLVRPDTSAVISRGVSKGVAVSKTTPIFFPSGPNASTWLGSVLYPRVPLVLLRVLEKVAVKLLDVIFGKGNGVEALEHELHHAGISRHLLFVPCRERS